MKGLDPVKQGGAIRRVSGVLTETAALYENLTVAENLAFRSFDGRMPQAADVAVSHLAGTYR